MRRIVPILALVVFLAALILDTGAVLRIAGFYGDRLAWAHPVWVALAAGAAVTALLWTRQPRPAPARRGGKRPATRAGGSPRKRPAAGTGTGTKPGRAAAPPPAEAQAAATPQRRRVRKPRLPGLPAR